MKNDIRVLPFASATRNIKVAGKKVKFTQRITQL